MGIKTVLSHIPSLTRLEYVSELTSIETVTSPPLAVEAFRTSVATVAQPKVPHEDMYSSTFSRQGQKLITDGPTMTQAKEILGILNIVMDVDVQEEVFSALRAEEAVVNFVRNCFGVTASSTYIHKNADAFHYMVDEASNKLANDMGMGGGSQIDKVVRLISMVARIILTKLNRYRMSTQNQYFILPVNISDDYYDPFTLACVFEAIEKGALANLDEFIDGHHAFQDLSKYKDDLNPGLIASTIVQIAQDLRRKVQETAQILKSRYRALSAVSDIVHGRIAVPNSILRHPLVELLRMNITFHIFTFNKEGKSVTSWRRAWKDFNDAYDIAMRRATHKGVGGDDLGKESSDDDIDSSIRTSLAMEEITKSITPLMSDLKTVFEKYIDFLDYKTFNSIAELEQFEMVNDSDGIGLVSVWYSCETASGTYGQRTISMSAGPVDGSRMVSSPMRDFISLPYPANVVDKLFATAIDTLTYKTKQEYQHMAACIALRKEFATECERIKAIERQIDDLNPLDKSYGKKLDDFNKRLESSRAALMVKVKQHKLGGVPDVDPLAYDFGHAVTLLPGTNIPMITNAHYIEGLWGVDSHVSVGDDAVPYLLYIQCASMATSIQFVPGKGLKFVKQAPSENGLRLNYDQLTIGTVEHSKTLLSTDNPINLFVTTRLHSRIDASKTIEIHNPVVDLTASSVFNVNHSKMELPTTTVGPNRRYKIDYLTKFPSAGAKRDAASRQVTLEVRVSNLFGSNISYVIPRVFEAFNIESRLWFYVDMLRGIKTSPLVGSQYRKALVYVATSLCQTYGVTGFLSLEDSKGISRTPTLLQAQEHSIQVSLGILRMVASVTSFIDDEPLRVLSGIISDADEKDIQEIAGTLPLKIAKLME